MPIVKHVRRSAGERAHTAHFVRTKDRERPAAVPESFVQRILADMESPDDAARARAVREICPCRMPWDVFERLRRAAKRLQHDPNPIVAANARHIEVDARAVAMHEGAFDQVQEQEDAATEHHPRPERRRRSSTALRRR
jgi:hypothetical protein